MKKIHQTFKIIMKRIDDFFSFLLIHLSHIVKPPSPFKKKSIFVKKVEMEINAWKDSPKFTLSETI